MSFCTLDVSTSLVCKNFDYAWNKDLCHENLCVLTLFLDLCVNFLICMCFLIFLKNSNDVLEERVLFVLLSFSFVLTLTSIKSSFFFWFSSFFDTFSRRESSHQRKSNVLPFNLRGFKLWFDVFAAHVGAVVMNSSDVWLIMFQYHAALQTGSKLKNGFASTILSKIISHAIYSLTSILSSWLQIFSQKFEKLHYRLPLNNHFRKLSYYADQM